MKRRKKQGLALNRSTIRTLASRQLREADGGRGGWGCHGESISSIETAGAGCTGGTLGFGGCTGMCH